MEKTREIRWFLEREHPGIRDWFSQLPFDNLETRTDYYLSLKKADIGAKYREGNLEIKHRLGTWSNGCLSEHHWGRFEDFIKWSFALADAEAVVSEIANAESFWIPVRKQRRIAILHGDPDSIGISPTRDPAGSGCQVEYSRVSIGGSDWHSVSFEFFGPSDTPIPESLILKILGKSALSMEQSQGYAEFLRRFNREGGTDQKSADHVVPDY